MRKNGSRACYIHKIAAVVNCMWSVSKNISYKFSGHQLWIQYISNLFESTSNQYFRIISHISAQPESFSSGPRTEPNPWHASGGNYHFASLITICNYEPIYVKVKGNVIGTWHSLSHTHVLDIVASYLYSRTFTRSLLIQTNLRWRWRMHFIIRFS